jgi:hypothetical protein
VLAPRSLVIRSGLPVTALRVLSRSGQELPFLYL